MAEGAVGAHRVVLVKPHTYMNRSGTAVAALAAAGVAPDRELLVLVDEVAIPLGTFRLRARGSAGGHNGLRSVEASLRSRDYARLRIGVGPVPADVEDLTDFVLAPFARAELERLEPLWPLMADAVECWLADGIETAMTRFNHPGNRSDRSDTD